MQRRTRLAVGLSAGLAATAFSASTASAAEPNYQMPFTCQESWTGSTRSSHSPSTKAIDFNREDDLGKVLVAAAPGVVTKVVNLGSRSYGLHVVIDHGNGRNTLYAHLLSAWVVPGQPIDQGQSFGQVGSTGGSSGPHLHYEQRVNTTVVTPSFAGVPFRMGATQASANCAGIPVSADLNADGTSEVGMFTRLPLGRFTFTGTPGLQRTLGKGTDDPLTGDWDGNGTDDVAIRRSLTQGWLLSKPGGILAKFRFGEAGDRPIAGDWNADGRDEVGVYRPRTGEFLLRAADGSVSTVAVGSVGLLPVTGDWNGDGVTDLGTFDPATATWQLRYVDDEGSVWSTSLTFGQPGDLPVIGDWDGNGRDNLAAWTPSTATLAMRAGNPTQRTATVSTRTLGRSR